MLKYMFLFSPWTISIGSEHKTELNDLLAGPERACQTLLGASTEGIYLRVINQGRSCDTIKLMELELGSKWTL